jgi:galactokinase/mevalonate kinase-like predicted kinase
MKTKKEMLQKVMEDFQTRKCVEIHIIWSDGNKSGIGNPKAIEVAMMALLHELERQINEQ